MSTKKRKRKNKTAAPKKVGAPNITVTDDMLDRMFCVNGKEFGFEKELLKAVAMVESNLKVNAYRFEEKFWERYLKDNPEWNKRDPKEVSASYGIMQIMYTTAAAAGFSGPGEELFNPALSIKLGAKILRELHKKAKEVKGCKCWPIDVALARYNGGVTGNPRPDGTLRNQAYVDKVKAAYWKVRATMGGCNG